MGAVGGIYTSDERIFLDTVEKMENDMIDLIEVFDQPPKSGR